MEPRPRVLFLFDSALNLERLGIQIREVNPVSQVDLCPMAEGRLTDEVKRLFQDATLAAGVVWPFNSMFHDAAFKLGSRFVQWVADFPHQETAPIRSIHQALRLGGLPFSLWEISLLAEKNTEKSPLFADLVRAWTLQKILCEGRYDEVWMFVRNEALASTIRLILSGRGTKGVDLGPRKARSDWAVFLSSIREAVRWLVNEIPKIRFVRRSMPPLGERLKGFRESKHLLVTYFPHVDPRSAAQSKLVDLYYGPLQRALERGRPGEVAWAAILVNFDGYDFKQSVALARRFVDQGNPLCLVKEWVGWRDLAWAIGVLFRSWLRISALLPRVRGARFEGIVPMWPLMRIDWFSSFAGFHLLFTLAHYRAFQKLLLLAGDRCVYYVCEMHAWEKALNLAREDRKRIRTIGIQHTTAPALFLPYCHAPGEIDRTIGSSSTPYPDLLGCVGESIRSMLVKEGWPSHRIFRLGALRFAHYPSIRAGQVPWSSRARTIIAALSLTPNESLDMLRWLVDALDGFEGFRVGLKSHPATSLEGLLSKLERPLPSTVFFRVSTELAQELKKARALVVVDTSVTLEGLAAGCPVIILRTPGNVDLNPLSSFCDLARYASDPSELRRLLWETVDAGSNPLRVDEAREFIARYCDFPTEEEYRARIHRALQGLDAGSS